MSEAAASAWLIGGIQCLPKSTSKWCELLGYEETRKKAADKFASQESHDSETSAPTRCPSNSPKSEHEGSKVQSEMSFTGTCASTRYPTNSLSRRSSSATLWSSPMKDRETANDMLVRTLGWVHLPAPKERFFEQVLGALEGLGVEYSVAQGEWSDVVEVQVACESEDADSSSSECLSPSSCGSSVETSTGSHCGTQMVGQLCVQLKIVAPSASNTDFHVTRQKGSVLRFHSFYHDLRNQLGGAGGWNEKAGRYSRIPAAP